MIFKLEVIKQRLPAGLVSHHEQASEANREQQHRVLWPAYNPNLAPRQASTQGLFQQTRLSAPVDVNAEKAAAVYCSSMLQTLKNMNERMTRTWKDDLFSVTIRPVIL